MAKYSIVKGKSGKAKKVIVAGVKKVLYKKEGSMAMYVISKKRHIKLSKYKKMKMKGGEGQTGGKKRKRKKTKGGAGFFESLMEKLTGKSYSSLPPSSSLSQQVQAPLPVTQVVQKEKRKSKK